MPPSLDFRLVQEWLAPFNLTLETLPELPPSLQAELLNFWLPAEAAELGAPEKAVLSRLGHGIYAGALAKATPRLLWQELFSLFLALHEPEPATQVFARLWSQNEPRSITYFSELIQLNLARQDLPATLKVFAEMRRRFPNRYTTFASDGEICLFQGNVPAAQAAYLKTLEIKPGSRRSLLNLALVASRRNDLKETTHRLAQLERHIRPGDGFALKAAHLWQKLGKVGEATRLLALHHTFHETQRLNLCRKIERTSLGRVVLPPSPEPVNSVNQEFPSQLVPVPLEVSPVDLPAIDPPSKNLPPEAYRLLKEIFGYTGFRPGQEEVISHVLAGRDTLVVQPTGAGKSLCYQLPALLLDRPVLVLSPLISLMKDQFDKLPAPLKEHTLVINSSVDPPEAARRLRLLSRPGSTVRLVYAAPERLRQTPFVKALRDCGLGLLVVDEAHCVTLWGHDFRPDYLFIRRALAGLTIPLLAVTATATPRIATEIAEELGRPLEVVRSSVNRPNLSFSVEKVKGKLELRLAEVAKLVKTLEGSGIIYTRSREKCEIIAYYLQRKGIRAGFYHAGLENEVRRQVQDEWQRGLTRVMVATIAFGMGIDKPDVRFILHYTPATSLENYLQEAGRAGRDGEFSRCIMQYSSSDRSNLTRWLHEENAQLDLKPLLEVYNIVIARLGEARHGLVPLDDILIGPFSVFPPPDEGIIRIAFSLLEKAGLLNRGFDLPSVVALGLPLQSPKAPVPPEVAGFVKTVGLVKAGFLPVDLVELADRLEISPLELDSRLLDWDEAGFINYRHSRRDPYLALSELKEGSTVITRLKDLLDKRHQVAEQRLNEMDFYLKNVVCRQVVLARHFGETPTEVCGICDNCTHKERKPDMASPFDPKPAAKQPPLVLKPVPKYSPDEITALILGCLRHITGGAGQIGRSGLVHLLMGKRSAFGTTANNPYKGKFAAFRVKEVENLVEKLVLTGFIEEHPATLVSGKTYQAIQVSDRGHLWLEDHQDLMP